jgi:hypothetical protein
VVPVVVTMQVVVVLAVIDHLLQVSYLAVIHLQKLH